MLGMSEWCALPPCASCALGGSGSRLSGSTHHPRPSASVAPGQNTLPVLVEAPLLNQLGTYLVLEQYIGMPPGSKDMCAEGLRTGSKVCSVSLSLQ